MNKFVSKHTGAIVVGVLLGLALFGIVYANSIKRKETVYNGDAQERLEIKGDIREAGRKE